MGRGEGQDRRRLIRNLQRGSPSAVQVAYRHLDIALELLTGRAQGSAGCRAGEKRSPDPLLQGSDPSAKSRLRNITALCRTRKIALFGKGKEIFQPI